jgi:hypothetical protein
MCRELLELLELVDSCCNYRSSCSTWACKYPSCCSGVFIAHTTKERSGRRSDEKSPTRKDRWARYHLLWLECMQRPGGLESC